jgi:hypothetical protein
MHRFDSEVTLNRSDRVMASSDDEQRSGLAGAAGRAAFFPARTAARAWRDEFESAVDGVLSAPEIARVIDRALAGHCRTRSLAQSFVTGSSSVSSQSLPQAVSSTVF